MRKALLLPLLLASSAALAGGTGHFLNASNATVFSGVPTNSKQAAYEMGYEAMSDLNSQSSWELSSSMPTGLERVDPHSFEILNSRVTVSEYLTDNGQLVYQPMVHVSYMYRVYDQD